MFLELRRRGLTRHDASKGLDRAWLSADGAMTKATLGGKAGRNPTDRGKLGTKRSLLAEGRGVPAGLGVDGANRNDFQLLRRTVESIPVARPQPSRRRKPGLRLDKGYDLKEVRELLREFGFTPHVRARGEEAQAIRRKPGFQARRRAAERDRSWRSRFRAILVRRGKKAVNDLATLHLACAHIAFTPAGLLRRCMRSLARRACGA